MIDLTREVANVIAELERRRAESDSLAKQEKELPKWKGILEGQEAAYTVAINYLKVISKGEPCPIT